MTGVPNGDTIHTQYHLYLQHLYKIRTHNSSSPLRLADCCFYCLFLNFNDSSGKEN